MIPSSLPSVQIASPDGARATIALDGGHVVSWVPAGEHDDRLFVSSRSHYGPGEAIRGGIPVVFPQFGPFGPLAQHGFARRSRWHTAQNAGDSAAHVHLMLRDTDETRGLWPHAFEAVLDIEVGGAALSTRLTVKNTGTESLSFTAAFHPYFAVRDAFASRVNGLHGCRYRDALKNGEVFTETGAALEIIGPLDRIYYQAPDRLIMTDGDRALEIEKSGFPEAVVWNPGAQGTSSRADFLPGDERHMLCVEAAVIEHPVVLAPGESWWGEQRMTAR